MKILVTGTSGRVGAAISLALRHSNHVVGLDIVPAPTTQVIADLGDAAALVAALRGCDAVVHAAALHAPHVGRVPDAEFMRVNVDATRQLLRLAADQGVRRFVLTSTTALYGSGGHGQSAAAWVDEQLTPRPQTIYHHSKLAAEQLVQEAAAAGDLSATVLRMSRCFPEPAPLMALYRLHRGIDLRDVVSAHEFALALTEPAYRLFVVSAATPFEPADAMALAIAAQEVLARRAPALVAEFARRGWPLPAAIDRVYASHALCRLGWQPHHGFEAVLTQLDSGSPEVLPDQ